jgi:hypothetical protein
MTIPATLAPAYFDAIYQAAADPWVSRTAGTSSVNTRSAA